jgi:hypothetical protein
MFCCTSCLYFQLFSRLENGQTNSSEFSIALGAFPCEPRVQKAAVGVVCRYPRRQRRAFHFSNLPNIRSFGMFNSAAGCIHER